MTNRDSETPQTDSDYMKPIREAAAELADRLAPPDAVYDVRTTLIEFAGAILDAVRVEQAEAIRKANLAAFDDEMARSLRS